VTDSHRLPSAGLPAHPSTASKAERLKLSNQFPLSRHCSAPMSRPLSTNIEQPWRGQPPLAIWRRGGSRHSWYRSQRCRLADASQGLWAHQSQCGYEELIGLVDVGTGVNQHRTRILETGLFRWHLRASDLLSAAALRADGRTSALYQSSDCLTLWGLNEAAVAALKLVARLGVPTAALTADGALGMDRPVHLHKR
jgi:hypothetical protein